jgi:cytochrome c-type biogenesis protein
MLTIVFALLAGVLTVAAPCTLPVLPILLGASVGQTGGLRPVFITLGFVLSFAAAVLVFSAITQIIGIDQNTLRTLAIALLIVFGLLMLWPRPLEWLSARINGLARARTPRRPLSGNAGGFLLGTTLGLVWTPCAGPVLGSILTVVAATPDFGRGAFLLTVYAIGAAVPMLAIAYGGQFVTTRVRALARVSHRLQRGFGIVIIASAAAMYFQYDALVTAWLADFYPNGNFGL